MASRRALIPDSARKDAAWGKQRSVAVAPWRHNLLHFLFVFILMGCTPVSSAETPFPVDETTSPESMISATPTALPPIRGLSAQQIRNAQYQLGFTDSPRTVQLTNGVFQEGTVNSTTFMEIRVSDFIALGDIDSDGVNEAAALISENYGGSGVFVFLAFFVEQVGQPVYVTSVFIDDRPGIDELRFERGEIFLSTTTHAANDPFCCPTLHNERHYRLINNQLDLTDYTTFTPDGRPRRIAIDSPANGADVFSTVQFKGSVAIAPFESNLTYRIYDVGGVELSAGAIAVTAPDLGAPGTFDSIINIGSLLSGSSIRIEIQDVSAADGSLLAMDSVELVVK